MSGFLCNFANDKRQRKMTDNPFIVCKASAGSGKTYTLVKEYLEMAFAGGEGGVDSRFRSILAITFTNKAAAEMKGRIMHELETMASAPVDPTAGGMGADIMRDLGIADGGVLSRMAARLHSAVLHHYSDLSVSTIDSFMHRVVRTFAHDLGQPMNFDVMIDQQEMVDEAVSQLMSLAGTDGEEELTEVLQAFADSQMEEDRGYNVERLMSALATQLFKEDVEDHIAQLSKLTLSDFRDIQQGYTAELRRYEAALRRAGAEMVAALEAVGLDADTAPYGMSGYYGYFSRMADGAIAPPTARTVAAMDDGKLTSAKTPKALREAAEAALPALRERYAKVERLLGEGLTRYNSLRAMLRNLYSMALLGLLDREMRRYARDNEVVHLSDFNRLINRVVQDEDNPAPFVYERLGNRYRHFLIDEFQDTSVMQWHNLVPLLENGVSQRCRSLVVGDGKQAIYRFRQGDVRQFARLPRVEGMKHHGHTLGIQGNYSLVRLDTNHRTASAIVEFNNMLFAWLARHMYADNALVQELYVGRDADGRLRAEGDEELRQRVSKEMRGCVKLDFVSKGDVGDTDIKEAIYGRIADTIETLVGERGYRYADIVVLARSNAELGAVSACLSARGGVPLTSTESFYLRESHAVMAVVAVLRLLHNRADRVAQADLVHRMQAMGRVGVEEGQTARDAFVDGGLLPTIGGIRLNLDYLESMDLYDCCETVVRELGLDGVDTPYVASLLNRVAAFAARHRQNVGEFLEWFDSQPRLSAAASDEVDAVRLLTIHKAKGLEAPVVICPLFYGHDYPVEMWVDVPAEGEGCQLPTAFVSLGNDELTVFEPQRREEQMLGEVDDLNILYVALTRPREQLYVFCPDAHDIKKPRERDLRYPALLRAFADAVDYDGGDEDTRTSAARNRDGKEPVRLERLSFADWTSKVHVASPSENAVTQLQEDKVRFGIYAHDLMAAVADADGVEQAISDFVAQVPDAADRERLAALARRVVTHSDARRFFDPHYTSKRECEMVVGGRRERPDRVVFAPEGTWVVDFKTGVPMAEHRTQVAGYCSAMVEMGYPAVSGYIVYLEPDVRVVEVPNFNHN